MSVVSSLQLQNNSCSNRICTAPAMRRSSPQSRASLETTCQKSIVSEELHRRDQQPADSRVTARDGTIDSDLVVPFNFAASGISSDTEPKRSSCCGSRGHQNGVELNGHAKESISTDRE